MIHLKTNIISFGENQIILNLISFSYKMNSQRAQINLHLTKMFVFLAFMISVSGENNNK